MSISTDVHIEEVSLLQEDERCQEASACQPRLGSVAGVYGVYMRMKGKTITLFYW